MLCGQGSRRNAGPTAVERACVQPIRCFQARSTAGPGTVAPDEGGTIEYQDILYSVENGVATIVLNRPGKLNALTAAMLGELRDALTRAETDADVRAVLVTGAGRGFCAGQDLNDPAVTPGDKPVDLGITLDTNYNPVVRAMRSLPKPVVVGLNGVAAGAGVSSLRERAGRDIRAFLERRGDDGHTVRGSYPDCGHRR